MNILIADDESSIRTILSKSLEKGGHQVVTSPDGDIAFSYLKENNVDLVFVDIRMPGMSGLEILGHQGEFSSHPCIIVMTAQDTMQNAVEAMKRGAYDYVTKPFDLEEIAKIVEKVSANRLRQKEYSELEEKPEINVTSSGLVNIVGKSRGIQEIFKTIGKVANQDVTVLVEGESGSGKEMIAKAIHLQGSRARCPFVAVNCSAIPANLLESELFGYKKGAFTGASADKMGYFERANHGTLFLDEIGDLPLALQAKLLRVLQEREIQHVGDTKTIPINVRIIAATNQQLVGKVEKGLFREDLYFRLNVVPIFVPPLRERRSDIPLLISYFLRKNAEDFKMPIKRISDEAMNYLQSIDWPGNIRELENLLKRVCVLSHGDVLELDDFKGNESRTPSTSAITKTAKNLDELKNILSENLDHYFGSQESANLKNLYDHFMPLMEKPLIENVLKKTKGNQLKASDILGINRNTLRKRMKDLGIPTK